MAQSTMFDQGIGFHVHARTKIVEPSGMWSIISNAAVQIGKDTLELSNDGSYYINGIQTFQLPEKLGNKYTLTLVEEFLIGSIGKGGSSKTANKRTTIYIDLDQKNDDKIRISLFKKMIAVSVELSTLPYDTAGMLGTQTKSGMVGRDSISLYNNHNRNEMVQQWQVTDTDPMLFQDVQIPQYPQSCTIPDVQSRRRLRMGVAEEFRKQAVQACGMVPESIRLFCEEDVTATGDVSIAQGYEGLGAVY